MLIASSQYLPGESTSNRRTPSESVAESAVWVSDDLQCQAVRARRLLLGELRSVSLSFSCCSRIAEIARSTTI